MKSMLRLFFISLIAISTLIICNCNNDKQTEQSQLKLSTTAQTANFSVSPLTCPPCMNAIKQKLEPMDGIYSVEGTLGRAENNLSVIYEPEKITVSEIAQALRDMGKDVTIYP